MCKSTKNRSAVKEKDTHRPIGVRGGGCRGREGIRVLAGFAPAGTSGAARRSGRGKHPQHAPLAVCSAIWPHTGAVGSGGHHRLLRHRREVLHDAEQRAGAAHGLGARAHGLQLAGRGAEPVPHDGGDLVGRPLKGAHAVVGHVRHVAVLLAGHKAVEDDGQAADERLGDGAGAGLGDDGVRGAHELVHVVHKALDHHVHVGRPRRGLQLGHQLLVAPADGHHLAVGVGPRQRLERLLQAAHPLAARAQQQRLFVGLQAQHLSQLGSRWHGL
mmetsp:Transcript_5805/g.14835  ORF Transcript_5805/g.14835 Transcript_5805/m.14835 type:complete len:272 (-) Transcript_5805:377-1192(-)